ncbi:hypothetical protein [Mariniphaga sp.]|uniref:hypothetical protein n=1 Tax=Mariniphaga sp. TaxID=1954475 RepID=UPI003569A136
MKKSFYFILLIFIPFLTEGQELTVQVDGDADFTHNLIPISEAGLDYPSTLQAESSVYVSVISDNLLDKKNNPNDKWRIHIHKLDMEWNQELALEARRTGQGFKPDNPGNPNIQDGDNFQPITNIPVYFFRGRGEIVQIPVALQLRGFSVTMGARDFETSLVFTVYDDW